MWTASSACSCFVHVPVMFLFTKSSPVWTGFTGCAVGKFQGNILGYMGNFGNVTS